MDMQCDPRGLAILTLVLIGADVPWVANPASHQGHMDRSMMLVYHVALRGTVELYMVDH